MKRMQHSEELVSTAVGAAFVPPIACGFNSSGHCLFLFWNICWNLPSLTTTPRSVFPAYILGILKTKLYSYVVGGLLVMQYK
jgi:hypothetical protein